MAQNTVRLSPGDVKIKDVKLEVQKTPEFNAGNVKSKKVSRPREWLEFEAEFEVDSRGAARDAVLNELLFRYYVGFVDSKTKQPVILSGDVTHINVLLKEEYYSAMYVPPSTVGKLTGDFRSSDDGAVVAFGVEVLHNGVLVGLWTNRGNAKFWEGKSITSNSVLPRDKTPFGMLWIDRYPESKTK